MAQEDNKMAMKIRCKWNGNFHSNLIEQKNWSTLKGPPSVLENFCLIQMYHFTFQLDAQQKILAKRKATHPQPIPGLPTSPHYSLTLIGALKHLHINSNKWKHLLINY